jgi:hypothetical protein
MVQVASSKSDIKLAKKDMIYQLKKKTHKDPSCDNNKNKEKTDSYTQNSHSIIY